MDVGSGAMVEGYGVPHTRGAVRFGTSRDVATVAALHSDAISEGFLSSLGDRFLRRLYARIVASSHGFLLVAEHPQTDDTSASDNRPSSVAGFVAGSAEVGRFYREFFLRDGLSVAFSSGVRLMRSLPRVVENVRYGARAEHNCGDRAVGEKRTEPEAELLALAVAPSARRAGVGAALVEAFLTSAAAGGSASARVVVGMENEAAIALYTDAGFREATRFEIHSGIRSMLMRTDLTTAGPCQ